MGRFSSFAWNTGISLMIGMAGTPAIAQTNQPLSVVYPPDNYETSANQIFLIGTAPAAGEVEVNGEAINRSPAGHFAPSFPLQPGENVFTLRYQDEELVIRVNRVSDDPPAPVGTAFAEGSLTPAVDIARLPNEPLCFSAIAPTNATVSVSLGNQTIPLLPQATPDLPPNSAVLTLQNQPITDAANSYQGCGIATQIGSLGQPQFELTLNGETIRQQAPGTVEILSPVQFQVVEVTAASGTARTGPSTDHSRLTPLPTGTRAAVTGREGEWYRLDYGAWIRATEVQVSESPVPPRSLIRSIRAERLSDRTQITFPLQVPVPVSVNQGSDTFTLTLYNTTAQTDTILLNDDPLIERLDWQQVSPDQIQYTFRLKTEQQWGYELAYEGSSLVLSLRHPPEIANNRSQPLTGISILLDPGHGGPEDLGSRGPTGYPEKDINLVMSQLIRDRLIARGATIYMTREGDADLYPQDRVDLINQLEPAIALSIHYNALPDSGDAVNTAGIGTFWYHPQAHSLAIFLHNYLVETRDRPSYGVFWNNLALTRPSIAPSVLLELGFMINPNEFEWIVDPEEQEQLAEAIAEGVTEWLLISE
jgi:N-acetylmuramoyl-L-alanine amidase